MKKLIFLFMLITICKVQTQRRERIVMSNPLNSSYRFQIDGVCRREIADPVIILFKDRYYLFASHSSGCWYSSNPKGWAYVVTETLKTVKAWAPALLIYKDALYYLGMGEERIYRGIASEADKWEEIKLDLQDLDDSVFLQDNDGWVYLYHGCLDWASIRGVKVDPENGFKKIGAEIDLIPHVSDCLGWEVFRDKND